MLWRAAAMVPRCGFSEGREMRSKRRLWRLLALFAAFGLILAACGDDSGDDEESTGDTTEGTEAPSGGESDGVFKIGGLLPQTGDLSFLGPPAEAGAQLAVNEINDAGGVLGNDLEYTPGDSGDTNTDIANQTTDRHLAAGVDAILGAESSGVSFTVIDKITGANVIEFSPANTSPDFTDYDDNGLYFRTAPSDVLQGRVLSDLIIADGHETVGIAAREDPYGEGLLNYTQGPLEEAGATVDPSIVYDPAAENFDAEVSQIVAANPDAFVMIGFEESAQFLNALFEQGYTQGEHDIYLVDGNIGNALGENFADAPGILEGIRGTLPSAEVSQEFQDRLLEIDPELTDYSYGPETYDAVVIMALAAEVAGTDDPVAVAAEINGVTRDGTTCTTFEECRDLIADGDDIDYDGVGGPYTFGDAGEPSEASFAIFEYGANNQLHDSLTTYQFAALDD